jgi:hypothetical protein
MDDAGDAEISERRRRDSFPGKIASLYLLWAAANGAPTLAIPRLASSLGGAIGGRHALAAVVYPTTLSLLALAQGLALARWLEHPGRWMLATVAGGTLAWTLGPLLVAVLDPLGTNELVLIAAAHGIGAALVAAAQACAARGRLDGASRLWIGASAASAAFFAVLFFLFWADAALPGYTGNDFAGSREMTTLLRVIGAGGLATAPALPRLVGTAGSPG